MSLRQQPRAARATPAWGLGSQRVRIPASAKAGIALSTIPREGCA